jgi:hypothetical protein
MRHPLPVAAAVGRLPLRVVPDPELMYRMFPWFEGEGFDLPIEDLGSLPRTIITLVEGFRLLPALVRPYVSEPDHAVWLIPTSGPTYGRRHRRRARPPVRSARIAGA